MPDYSTQVMDSVLPPDRSVSSRRRHSKMYALQDETGSGAPRGLPMEVAPRRVGIDAGTGR